MDDSVVNNNKEVSDELGASSESSDVSFCGSCGAKQTKVSKFCSFCGKPLNSISSFAIGTLNTRKKLGLAGSILLLCGVFTPIISLPLVGNISLLSNGRDTGIVILILAITSLSLVLSNKYKGLWFTSPLSIIAMFFTFTQFKDAINLLKEDASGNIFSGLVNMTVQFQWGWGVLISGAVLLLLSAGLKDKASLESRANDSKWMETKTEVNNKKWQQDWYDFLVRICAPFRKSGATMQKLAENSEVIHVDTHVTSNIKLRGAKLIIAIIGITLVASLVLVYFQNDQPVYANISPFTKGEVCKGVIASISSKPVNVMTAMHSGNVVIVSYNHPDGENKREIYRCKLEGNTGTWSMANGRWRTGTEDPKTTFKVLNGALYIIEDHVDGSSEQKIFGKDSFERNYGHQ